MARLRSISILFGLLLGTGCSSVTIDQMRLSDTSIDIDNETVVVLGRQHSAAYEAERDLVNCVASELSFGASGMQVIAEEEFVNQLYPWFEPRTAPLSLERFGMLLQNGMLQEAIDQYAIRYIIWIEGATERVDSSGGLSCSITAAGGGCLGMGIWEDEGSYEASIWDFQEMQESGRISADSRGTSYMPAVIVPIPLLAMVQTDTCRGLGKQIQNFIVSG